MGEQLVISCCPFFFFFPISILVGKWEKENLRIKFVLKVVVVKFENQMYMYIYIPPVYQI